MLRQVHRWYPDRPLIAVGDRAYAALDLLHAVRAHTTVVTRLRLDARLFAPPPASPQGQPREKGRPRLVGVRLPNLAVVRDASTTNWQPLLLAHWYSEQERSVEIVSDTALWYSTGFPPVPIRWVLIRDLQETFPTQALLCTDLAVEPQQILSWFVVRWQLEVTFHEVRAHLGVETQRQWNALAIARTTLTLFGVFSLVTLLAQQQWANGAPTVRQASWYAKTTPTFSDALAQVRRHLWTQTIVCGSPGEADLLQISRPLIERLTDLLCYAA